MIDPKIRLTPSIAKGHEDLRRVYGCPVTFCLRALAYYPECCDPQSPTIFTEQAFYPVKWYDEDGDEVKGIARFDGIKFSITGSKELFTPNKFSFIGEMIADHYWK